MNADVVIRVEALFFETKRFLPFSSLAQEKLG